MRESERESEKVCVRNGKVGSSYSFKFLSVRSARRRQSIAHHKDISLVMG